MSKQVVNAEVTYGTALVLGCGASGLACARYLAGRGSKVIVADSRNNPPGLEKLRETVPDAEFVGGALPASLADRVEVVVMSPGLSLRYGAAAPVVARALETGKEVIGEIELFARALSRLKAETGYSPKVVAITGTNGKTTTTTITGLMLQEGGLTVCVAGNIGPNVIAELEAHEKAGTLPEAWVLELSSFQLETTYSLKCDAAAFLNLTQDHVDWHGSMQAYGEAKKRIFSENTLRVVNRDDAESMSSAEGCTLVSSFGDGYPTQDNSWGIAEMGSLEWLCWHPPKAEEYFRKNAKNADACEVMPDILHLMPANALRIRGRHNAMNALAALSLACGVGINLASALSVLTTYRGEAHRVQFVLETGGIEFIDDSKGTNVGATAAALEGLGANGQKSSIILGGDGKGQDFSPIAEAIAKHARHVVLIGRDAELIGEAVKNTGVPVENAGTDFDLAIELAYKAAKPGDAVLLSPACASWDMFKNYAERSELFVAKAREIAMDNGSVSA